MMTNAPRPFPRFRAGFAIASLSLLLMAATTARAASTTLYSAASGLPSTQGWVTLGAGVPGSSGTQALAGGVLTQDSTPAGLATYGNFKTSPLTLDTATGFTLDFSLKVLSESHHADGQRAGFSLLFIGNDPKKSLELAFWTDKIWAYGLSGLSFTNSNQTAFDTQSTLTSYSLKVTNHQFSLFSGGSTLLSGALADYTPYAAVAPPATSVYAQSNLLFFGDDSTRAAAQVQIGQITLTPVPEPSSLMLMACGGLAVLLGALGQRRRQ